MGDPNYSFHNIRFAQYQMTYKETPHTISTFEFIDWMVAL